MTDYTEAEEAFIESQISILVASQDLLDAQNAQADAIEQADEPTDNLDLPDGKPGIDLQYNLVLEAAERAGFHEDSEVLGAIHEAYAYVCSLLAEASNGASNN